jgi:Urocanase Rossmann-like domain
MFLHHLALSMQPAPARATIGENHTLEPITALPSAFSFLAEVERAHSALLNSALADHDIGLGGKLLYAGELDAEGRAFIAAANIAGAATLATSADRSAQKQAMRDGIADFLVATLDESLRILKNQLRKREPVAVCVGVAPEEIEREMLSRGVKPDLERSAIPSARNHEALLPSDAAQPENNLESVPTLLTWSVASAPAKWLPQLDAIALECLDADDWSARRWLRLSQRYLGRLAQGIRAVACSRQVASSFIEQVQKQVERGEIGVPVEIFWRDPHGHLEKHELR